MDFKELLMKYKSGNATPDEAELIKQEIEKFESLNDFLADELANSIAEAKTVMVNDVDKAAAKKVKRIINRKFMLTAAISVAIIIIGLVMAFYMVSPLVDQLNYQPLKEYNRDFPRYNKLFIDTAVYTWLHFPGYDSVWATAEHLGFGNYDVKLCQFDEFTNSAEIYTCKIENGKFKYLMNTFYKHAFTSLALSERIRENFLRYSEGDDSPDIREITKLPATAVVKSFVFFKDDITIEELCRLASQNKNLSFKWVGVRASDENTASLYEIGFDFSSRMPGIDPNDNNKKMYPSLDLFWNYPKEPTAEVLKTHFTSLLKYMNDNKDFLKILYPHNPKLGSLYVNYYTDVLKYIEKNGINARYCLVTGYGPDLLALRNNQIVKYIILDNVKLSSYSN